MPLEASQLCSEDVTGKVRSTTEGTIGILSEQFSSLRMHLYVLDNGRWQFRRAVKISRYGDFGIELALVRNEGIEGSLWCRQTRFLPGKIK